MSQIQVFVNMGMGGRGTATFQVRTDMKVSEFEQLIIEKEGAEGVRVIALTKILQSVRNGKVMTLADYGVYNNLTMHAALRLKGGAEGPSVGSFSFAEVEKLGAIVVCHPSKPNNGTGKCIYNMSDGCTENNVPKAKLQCGCVWCADCMKIYVNQQIDNNLAVTLSCGDTSHGKNIDVALAYATAGLTNNERNALNAKMASHQFKRDDAIIKYCPYGKCQQFVYRENAALVKVECGVCHKFMCWKCGKEYKGKQEGHCGNVLCDPAAHISLHLAEAKVKDIYGVKVTDTRICPNKKCSAVNMHDSVCKHMKCKACKHQYCHICLQDWSGHNDSICSVAPEQQITNDMKLKK